MDEKRPGTKPLNDGPQPSVSAEDVLAHLVGYQTTAGNDRAFHGAFKYVAGALRSCGLTVARLEHNGHESLLASTRADELWRPSLCIGAHLDVVPASPEMFSLRSDSRAFRGRGVFDMKWVVASMVRLAAAVQDERDQYSLGFMLTSDEETRGADGTGWLLAEGYRPTLCVLPDAGRSDGWNVESQAKGTLKLTMRATGKAAHGSRPWEGENAIVKLVGLLGEVSSLYSEQGPDTTTINIGTIAGGEAVNQVAASAEATLDVRYMTERARDDVQTRLKRLAAQYGVELAVVSEGGVHRADPTSPLGQVLVETMAAVIGYEPAVVTNLGASDARYFDEYGVPCFVIGPQGGGHHGPSEWIDRNAVDEFTAIVRQLARKMSTPQRV
jgi:succinyl-diaminopimelate desuccinylase